MTAAQVESTERGWRRLGEAGERQGEVGRALGEAGGWGRLGRALGEAGENAGGGWGRLGAALGEAPGGGWRRLGQPRFSSFRETLMKTPSGALRSWWSTPVLWLMLGATEHSTPSAWARSPSPAGLETEAS